PVDPELDSVPHLDGLFQQPRYRHLSPQYPYAMSLPPTPICFAFVCEITPSVVVRISTPKSWAGRYRTSHFSRSVRLTANRGLITPQLLMLPTRATRYRFPRPSSISSNDR